MALNALQRIEMVRQPVEASPTLRRHAGEGRYPPEPPYFLAFALTTDRDVVMLRRLGQMPSCDGITTEKDANTYEKLPGNRTISIFEGDLQLSSDTLDLRWKSLYQLKRPQLTPRPIRQAHLPGRILKR
jgi:hypothetical protein